MVPAAFFILLGQPQVSHAQRAPSSASTSADSDLSAAQKARVASRKARFDTEIAAVQADKKLTDAQKGAKLQSLAQQADADLLAILTPEQRAQVLKRRNINVQFKKDLDALRIDTTLSEAQKKAKFEVMMKAREQALLATLPPAQRAAVIKEHDARIKAQQQEMARMAPLRRQIEEIGSSIQKSESPAQLKQIQTISQTTRQQEQAVYTDNTLSPSTKEIRIDALRHQAQSRIDALLTPAQRAKFARMRALISSAPAP